MASGARDKLGAMPPSSPILTFLSDFGTRDYYVAAVKGVILARAPGTTLVDVSHEVAPGDVAEGALLLAAALPCFPPGAVHLAVVDPGVGSERRLLALETVLPGQVRSSIVGSSAMRRFRKTKPPGWSGRWAAWSSPFGEPAWPEPGRWGGGKVS